jgi:RND family efflux transporter MFP subunit
MKIALRVLLPVLVLAGAGYATLTLIESRPAPETRIPEQIPQLVETITSPYQSVTLRVHAEGTVAPSIETQLVLEVSGRVIEVSPVLVPGGFFEEGEVLFRLEGREYELAVTRARAALAQANLRLETERQEAALALAEWALLGDGEPTPLAVREPQILEAEASLEAARASLEQAEYDLERTIVRAPYAGRVRQETIDLGQFVSRGNPVATVYSVEAAEVRLPVSDSELAFVDLPLGYRRDSDPGAGEGAPVILYGQFAGEEHRWEGRIVRTEGEIDPGTRMVHAVARVEDPYRRDPNSNRPPLAVGMFVRAEIIGRSSGRVVALPRSVMRSADRVLTVDASDRLRFRQVEIFRLERDRVLISSGISEDDRIVVSPLENAIEGQIVRVQSSSTD